MRLVWAWWRAAIWSHDRGGCTVYIRMLTASSDMSAIFKSMVIFKLFANSALVCWFYFCFLQLGLTKCTHILLFFIINIFTQQLFFHLMYKPLYYDCTHYSSLLVMLHYSEEFGIKIKHMYVNDMKHIAEGCLQHYTQTFQIHFTYISCDRMIFTCDYVSNVWPHLKNMWKCISTCYVLKSHVNSSQHMG